MSAESYQITEPSPRPRAVCIARVSSIEQTRGFSLDAQGQELKRLLEARGYEVPDEFVLHDGGYQGTDFNRPALTKARKLIHAGQAQCVAWWAVDRMARDILGGLKLVDEFKKLGADVFCADLNAVVSGGSAELKTMLTMKLIWAETEKQGIKNRIALAKRGLIEKGSMTFSRTPFGYRRVTTNKVATLVVEPTEAQFVKQIFEWAGAGLSLRKIGARLRAICPTRTTKLGAIKACTWRPCAIRYILANTAYLGIAIQGRFQLCEPDANARRKSLDELRDKKTSKIELPKDQWREYACEPLIGRGLFDRAQKALERNAAIDRGRRATRDPHQNPLRGLLWCRCGRRVLRSTARGTTPVMLCSSRSEAPTFKCERSQPRIAAALVNDVVWSTLFEAFEDQKGLEERVRELARSHAAAEPSRVKEIRDRVEQLRRQETYARKQAIKYTDERENRELYEQQADALRNERRSLEAELGIVATEIDAPDVVKELWGTVSRWLEEVCDAQARYELIRAFVAKVVLDQRTAHIDLRIPTKPGATVAPTSGGTNCLVEQILPFGAR